MIFFLGEGFGFVWLIVLMILVFQTDIFATYLGGRGVRELETHVLATTIFHALPCPAPHHPQHDDITSRLGTTLLDLPEVAPKCLLGLGFSSCQSVDWKKILISKNFDLYPQ